MKRAGIEIVRAVVEREDHAARRQGAGIHAPHGLVQRQYVASGLTDQLETPAEHGRAHVELWIPEVLVVDRDPVISDDEQAILSPPHQHGRVVEADRVERLQRGESCSSQNGRCATLSAQAGARPGKAGAPGQRRTRANRRRSWKLRS